ncbi:two-component regulator propeller domain-containing protein [Formosa sp. PL04]|uniref:hybrid sensor histidine kinase/response regulator transcription factor n=1 Tax=Formosa sp. PL04 TaxID=3081755 RepID=UPI002982540F|nr:two-component regulator propeller domain-containing protein [Formosa sp. PL04]MDW5289696.1 two-component regulator propeller domain-containing protein [Formosa sp. PL04]
MNLSYAQNFEQFSNNQGLNHNTINVIEQDHYGFLWYGTPNGIVRYDGYEFKTYTSQSKINGSLNGNYIYSLCNDDKGVMWIGTNLGLNVYIPWLEKFYIVPLSNKISISHIDVDSTGRVWFSGENQLYVCELVDIEKGTFKVSDNILESYSRLSSINSFIFKDDSTLILGTSLGLKQLSLKAKESYILSDFDVLNDKEINSLTIIKNILWIGTTEGLYKATLEDRLHIIDAFNDSKKQPFPVVVNTILEDHSGMVWVGTQDNGLYKYDQKEDTFEHFAHNKKNKWGISSKHINTIYEDDFNILWIGTAQGGLNKLDLTQKSFITYEHDPYDFNSISDNLLTSILEDNKGRLWLSGYHSTLFRSTNSVNDKTVSKLEFEDLHAKVPMSDGDIIRCIYEDEKGFIWLGLDNAVVVYNPLTKAFKTAVFKNKGNPYSVNSIWEIIQIDKTHMLLGGHEILLVENPWQDLKENNNSLLNIKLIYDLKDEYLQVVLKDDKNSFWFGTTKGLLHGVFKQDKIIIDHEYNTQSKDIRLSYNDIFTLHKEKNHLWIGTFGGGLNKMTLNSEGLPIKIEYFRKDDILPGDVIYGILQEGNSHLWLSTDMGLVKFNIEDNKTNDYDIRDGLHQNNFRQNSFFKGNSGYFYFGGLNGLTVFKPEIITLNTQVPEILITSLLIDNKLVEIGEEINHKVVLDKSISETESITISQSQRIISFNLAVKHTSVPSKNKLAFKLEGFNNNWIEEPTGKTTVTYTNLSAGDYVFRVKAANGDGVWSNTDKQLSIKILPPWYNTWWSYLLFFILTVSICLGIIIYFVQHEKLKQGLKYEKMDKERIETINQGKFRYFTNLSHEFRTPLTLISGPLERIIASNSDLNNTKYLSIIQKNTKRLLSLADQLITFRQAEQGHVNLKLVKCTLGDFIYPTTEAFENYALEKNINFFYKITEPNEEIILDIEKFERIIFNLLSNSFKNTPAQGNISIEAGITMVSGEKIINIDVIDTGKGIPPENLDNIFERFYQLGTKLGDVSGGGIGLSFCKSLVNLLGGEISVKSNPKIETRFSVKIPSRPIDDYLLDNINLTEKSYIKDWVPLVNNVNELEGISPDTKAKKEYTILVVENEEDVQNFLMTELSVKYNVIIANNGIEALDKIKLKEPDLIVSDVMMPEMDGYELCEKIKSDPATCHIPVLLLTALGDNDNVIKGLEFGSDAYISKPFSLKHLELRINKLIQNNVQIKRYFSKNSLLPIDNKDLEFSKKDKTFLENIVKVIEKNLSNSNFGVEELSTELGSSTSHFYKRFKQLTGQSPNVYIRNYRLQRAAELLKSNEGFNVTEVMYQIGIESNSYFSASFKKLHGVSPSEFLKRK